MRVPFVENCGQWDERVAFAANTDVGTVFVTRAGQIVYSLGDAPSRRWSLTETAVSGRSLPKAGSPSMTRVSYFHHGHGHGNADRETYTNPSGNLASVADTQAF